jgi:hypothetical protein
VGKAASHANQTALYLTPLHGRVDVPKRLIANIGAPLQRVRAAAEQFKDSTAGAACWARSATGSRLSSGRHHPRRGSRRRGNRRI